MGIWYQLEDHCHNRVNISRDPLLITSEDERLPWERSAKLAQDIENELKYILGCDLCVKVWIR